MTGRVPLIAGNWKMHRDHLEAIQLVQKLAYQLTEEDTDGQEVVVCPPFVALRSVQTLIQSDSLRLVLGAQDCHPEDEGAYTGEVSARMLARLDVGYVIVGHSERRALFGEDDALVNRKVRAVQRSGLRPILCVGETLEEREAGRAVEVVAAQLRGSLAGIEVDDPAALVVAYEPVWAIGTGRTATSTRPGAVPAVHVRRVVRDPKRPVQAHRQAFAEVQPLGVEAHLEGPRGVRPGRPLHPQPPRAPPGTIPRVPVILP